MNYLSPRIELEESNIHLRPRSQVEMLEPNYRHLQPHSQVEMTEPNYRHLFIQSHLVNVISSLTPVKMAISQHFYMMGRFPVRADAINISTFDLKEYEQIDSSFMIDAGGVGVYLSSTFGD